MLRQYNLNLQEWLIVDVEDAAMSHGRESGNQVVAEIIEAYLPFWIAAEEARKQVYNEQRVEAGILKH